MKPIISTLGGSSIEKNKFIIGKTMDNFVKKGQNQANMRTRNKIYGHARTDNSLRKGTVAAGTEYGSLYATASIDHHPSPTLLSRTQKIQDQ